MFTCTDTCRHKAHYLIECTATKARTCQPSWQLRRQEYKESWDKPPGTVLKHLINSINISTKQLLKPSVWARRAHRHCFPFPTHCHPTATHAHPHTPACLFLSSVTEVHTATFAALDIQKKSSDLLCLAVVLYSVLLSPFPWGLEGCFGGVKEKVKIIGNWSR